jgi:hypothetical protein
MTIPRDNKGRASAADVSLLSSRRKAADELAAARSARRASIAQAMGMVLSEDNAIA